MAKRFEIEIDVQDGKKKRKTKVSALEIYTDCVAGLKYGDIQSADPEEYKAGAELNLTWERTNEHDDRAIRVDTLSGVKLGYIKGSDNELVHQYRESGYKVLAFVRGYFPTNPSWTQLTIVLYALENPALNNVAGEVKISG